jgi:hypothetical protein
MNVLPSISFPAASLWGGRGSLAAPENHNLPSLIGTEVQLKFIIPTQLCAKPRKNCRSPVKPFRTGTGLPPDVIGGEEAGEVGNVFRQCLLTVHGKVGKRFISIELRSEAGNERQQTLCVTSRWR